MNHIVNQIIISSFKSSTFGLFYMLQMSQFDCNTVQLTNHCNSNVVICKFRARRYWPGPPVAKFLAILIDEINNNTNNKDTD